MASSFAASRAQLVFALCLPIAVLMGYLLAEPDFGNILMVSLIVGILSIPILMYWYHPLLIFTWNAAISPLFLPGQPFLWMLFAFVGFAFAVVNRFTSPDNKFVAVTSINRSLLTFLLVVLGTAWLRGGLGMRSFGSGQYGGKGYFYVLAALFGYFALISLRVPKHRANLFVAIFFISGLTALVPNLAYLGGSKFEFLFWIFPPVYAYEQAAGDYSVTSEFARVYGLTFASNGLYCWLLAKYGFRGIFDLSRPLRMVLFIGACLGTLFCGYRGFMVLFLLTLIAQFFAEKLYRPRIVGMLAACGVIVACVTLPFAERLPLVVQRSIAFVPGVAINPAIRANAESSSDWRLQMWRDAIQDIPKYLIKGKGYNVNPNELEMAIEDSRRGFFGRPYAWALITGAYHNGPLTLIIPFGIAGFAAFTWFVVASLKYLYRNFKQGDPALKTINTFLFAYFVARLVYFTIVFGNFYSDLFQFTGIIGLSVSINGLEVAEEEKESDETEAAHAEEFAALAERD